MAKVWTVRLDGQSSWTVAAIDWRQGYLVAGPPRVVIPAFNVGILSHLVNQSLTSAASIVLEGPDIGVVCHFSGYSAADNGTTGAQGILRLEVSVESDGEGIVIGCSGMLEPLLDHQLGAYLKPSSSWASFRLFRRLSPADFLEQAREGLAVMDKDQRRTEKRLQRWIETGNPSGFPNT